MGAPDTLHNRTSRSFIALVTLLSLGALAACGSDSADAASSDGAGGDGDLFPITLRADIYYTGAFMPFLAGKDAGIFEEHGIDLKLEPGKGSATTIQTVGNGSDDIGYADAGAVVQSAGKGIPVQVIAGMVQETPLAIAGLPDGPIEEPEDLEGKTGAFTPGSASELLFPGYAEEVGIDPANIGFQNVDFALRDQLLLEGSVDFTFGFTNGNLLTVADACDCELNLLTYADAGMVALSSSLVVSKEFAENNGDKLRDFLAATAEAVELTKSDPDAAVDAFFRVAPDSQLSPELVREQWDVSVDLLHSDATSDQPFGCMAESDWESTIELQEKYGGVDAGSVDLQEIYTNEFLPGDCE